MKLATLPRFPLATLPTPLQRMRRLEAAIGAHAPRIYFKRDDLTGLAFGGNKARKLEYLVADALAICCSTTSSGPRCRLSRLPTTGPPQSSGSPTTSAVAVKGPI